ncbi:MAG: thioredoxin-dependent thiol peroxidase [Pelobium sp.]
MAIFNVGDAAPLFTAHNQNGEVISLADFKGKKVILYFYPKDNTPGCNAEACNFRDNYQFLKGKGFEVIGVSTDDVKSHKKFETKFELPFNIIADTEKDIVHKYGVWVEKSMYGKTYWGTARKTFLIDEHGKIASIIEKVDTKNASQQLLDVME